MEIVLTQSYLASAGEVNPEGELALGRLIGNIIDVATRHANSLGIGNATMADMNCGWVLSRLTIEMQRWPRANETYCIRTWIESWNRHFSERSFEICDGEGNTLGWARSIWMVLNTITHTNAGTSHLNLPAGHTESGKRNPIPRQGKHHPIEGEPIGSHPVKYTDMDFYRHVNTLIYSRLVLDTVSLDDFDRNFISRFEMSFMHEGRYGHTLEIRRGDAETDGLVPYSITDGDLPIVYVRMRLSPRPAE